MKDASVNGVPITVKFVTEITEGKRKETIAFRTNGQYYIKGNASYLSFPEQNQFGAVKTNVKISAEEVLIMRTGAIKMRQAYRKKAITKGMYQNPLGAFELSAKTNNIEYTWFNHSRRGQLFLVYELNVQGDEAGRYAITITFKEEN